MVHSKLRRAVRLALASSAATSAMCSVVAIAQEQPAEEAELGTVVVTGSRIPNPNLTSISPVTAVSAENVRIEGITRVEDLINNLPQAFADFGGNLSNGATGAASVNLRGLGAQRTLVLVNGRRLMPGDPTQNGNGTADLNQIPASLIQRVEVLTGGASAVYGADAVAGVVNFIMDTDFEGVRIDAQYGLYQHDNDNDSIASLVSEAGFDTPESDVRDGYSRDITFALGLGGQEGRGHATVYAGYRELDPLLQSERDFSACALGSGDVFSCSGSSTGSPARLQAVDQDPNSATFGAEDPDQPGVTIGPSGELIPFTAANLFNFAPTNYYQRPDERYTAGLFADYAVSDRAEAYAEFMFMNDETLAQIAPSGLFRGSGPVSGAYIVNCDNPFLSAEQVGEFCTSQGLGLGDDTLISIGKRNAEGGGRVSDLEHTSYRAVVGLRGDITDVWGYDVYGLYGTTEYSQTYFNDFSLRRGGNALLAVTDPTTGQTVCRINADANTTNDDPACVPYNIFQPDGVTPEALAYVQTPGFQNGQTTEQIANASITGNFSDYVQLPWATEGLGVAFGGEYRREESELRNDVAFSTGDLAGQGGATLDTAGAFDVKEVFAEARLPLVTEKPGAQFLSLEAGYRYSDYSLGFTTDAYKVGADWVPFEALRLRGSFQRAVRAPNIQELFRPQVVQLDGNTDPCAVDNPGQELPTRTFEECARTGVSAGQYGFIATNPAAQYNGLTGGEPNLDPESSDTVSFGFVVTPPQLDGLQVAVDWFNITVDELVGPYGADTILNICLDTGDPQFCELVNRAPGSGSLWLGSTGFVRDLNVNTGSLETSGVDLEANYGFDLPGGEGSRLAFQLIGTWVNELVTEPVTGLATYDCAGLYGTVCGVPTPEWRTKLRTTWNTPWNLGLTLTWRHIEDVDLDASVENPNFNPDNFALSDATLDAVDYLDLAASYSLDLGPSALTMRLGINNLTDEDPPLVGQSNAPSVFANGNTFPQVYDTLGRLIFLNVTADF